MKPKNFPGRKNARRIQAVEEVQQRIAREGSRPLWDRDGSPAVELDTLHSRIVSPETARAERSKKRRPGRIAKA